MPEPTRPGNGNIRRGLNPGTILLALLAAAFGYLFASRLDTFLADRSGVKREITVMNTSANIVIPADSGSRLESAKLADLAEQAIREVDALMSPVGETSDVKKLNSAQAGTWIQVSPLTWTVVMEALRWHRLTGGAFDPTIGPVKRLFHFNQSETDAWPDAAALAAAKERVGGEKVLFEREGMRLSFAKDGMRLDLGAIAKGYGADRAIETLLANGVKNALVEIGGEVRTIGVNTNAKPSAAWKAGIENPRGKGYIPLPDINDKSLATSGDVNQYFIYKGKRFEHIIDPRIGLPLGEGIVSVTVIHPTSCMAADALATALTVLGREEGRKFLAGQALGLFKDGVRVIMLLSAPDGALRRVDFAVDNQGAMIETESEPAFVVPQESGEERPKETRQGAD